MGKWENLIKAYLARQLSYPSGWVGQLVVHLMNRENASMNQLALEQLPLQPGQHILEIGFGGGDFINCLFQTQISLQITGIDPSSVSMAVVSKRFKQEIKQGKLNLQKSQAEVMAFPKQAFDGIATINTLYFWSDIGMVLQECHRILKPGGILVVAYNSRAFLEQNQMTQYGFQGYEVKDFEAQMQDAGFSEIKTLSRESISNGEFFCTCGIT